MCPFSSKRKSFSGGFFRINFREGDAIFAVDTEKGCAPYIARYFRAVINVMSKTEKHQIN